MIDAHSLVHNGSLGRACRMDTRQGESIKLIYLSRSWYSNYGGMLASRKGIKSNQVRPADHCPTGHYASFEYVYNDILDRVS